MPVVKYRVTRTVAVEVGDEAYAAVAIKAYLRANTPADYEVEDGILGKVSIKHIEAATFHKVQKKTPAKK